MTDASADTPAADRPKTVPEIIKYAGGAAEIAKASDGAVTIEAVYKWPKIGIPDRHWGVIRGLCNVTAEELYAANVAARTPADAASR
ncbi:hypothetical protein HAP47_0022975 [Bradyrhizobium sp. 41S5]|uniref:hypothetical protein n=1 Tax=Bradyrhizobium sp. 41S5 TaxID=1404443 RepID=UPI00156B9B34|nr:hypothetical protein [Bradyrhizobium sp. 41S5]UFX42126.1 hypothetical protein HAP47_0022975 [Bradyrhizobium sp. 41S5]